jgi:conjugal transfer pilus assembly protein TraF
MAALLLMSAGARAEGDNSKDSPTYGDRERGWHWYEPIPVDPEPREELPVEDTAPPQEEGPPPFSVEWLQAKIEETKRAAITDPSPEKVELYLYYQKAAMDKAEAFAMAYQQAVTTNPDLDETVANPVVKTARTARRRVRDQEQTRVLGDLSNQIGIYYFFKSDCPYCAQQNPVMRMIATENNFSVLAISIDGLPMQTRDITEYVVDQGQAEMLGVTSTPTMFLVNKDGGIAPLAVGVQSLDTLKSRILQVAYSNKWISKGDFDAATKGAPKDLLIEAVMDHVDDVDWNDPAQALEAFRSISETGLKKPEEMTGDNSLQSTPLR